ncbi:MAG: deoxyribose-phosphate aldolase [Candidatus Acidiferrales bacterium]
MDADIARLIDHTLLKPDASRDEVRKLCQEAVRFGFASVCINPSYVSLAAELVHGSNVKVCTVVGFPLGATLPQVKIYETEEVMKLGAQEIDMVINVGALKSKQDEVVESDIRGVVEASHHGGGICKVIIEAALLTVEEKVRACVASKSAGADFVKTSTGFGPGGATAEDVALMRAVVGGEIGVKAAGGVRTLEDFKKMVAAGATRIGASASVKILEQARTGGASPN